MPWHINMHILWTVISVYSVFAIAAILLVRGADSRREDPQRKTEWRRA